MQSKRILTTALVFLCGVAVALIAAKYLFAPQPPEAPPVRTLTAEEVAPVLRAADSGDYETLARLGEELFTPGTRIPGSAAMFDEYSVASYAPHQVYALLTEIGEGRRVLLTMNEDDTVESFMAEETPISR